METPLVTVILSLITSGVVGSIVAAILDHRRRNAEASLAEEHAESADIANLKAIIDTWEKQYGALVKRLDAAELGLMDMRDQNAQLLERLQETETGARLALSNMRAQLRTEQQQRRKQAGHIIELTKGLESQRRRIAELSDIIESQAATISGLRNDLTESEKKRRELKEELRAARNEIAVLTHKLEIMRADRGGCPYEVDAA